MARKTAIFLAVLMLAIIMWGLFFEGDATTIIINGHALSGPFNGAIGLAGVVVAMVAFFCAAILLLFVFAGIGIVFLGAAVVVGLMLAWLMFPQFLLLLIPLAIIWAFIALTRRPAR
jgi:hypothetical protein